MTDDGIWALEEGFWIDGQDAWDKTLQPQSVMAFPDPVGVLSGDQIAESLKAAPRWACVDIIDRVLTRPGPSVTVLGYRAAAVRPGASPYRAYCTSTYALEDGAWRLVQHQQTPIT